MNEQKLHIIERVWGLYQKYGIKSITMDDVSRELGISKKTLYQHVKNKDELVQLVIQNESEKRFKTFADLSNKNINAIDELFEVNKIVRDILQDYNPAMEYDLKKYYPHIYNAITEKKRDRMYVRVLNNIKKGKKEGLYRKEVNEEVIAKLYVSRIENVCETDMFEKNEYTAPDFVLEIMNYHIRGIANEKGITFLEQKLEEQQ